MRPRATLCFIRELSENSGATYSALAVLWSNLDPARLFVQRACVRARLVYQCVEWLMSRDFASIEGMIAHNILYFFKVPKAVTMIY